MISAFLTGFSAAFSLILAIGAQNAFVLRQGLKGENVLWLVLFCSISDAILVSVGVAGFGAIVSVWPGLPRLMALAGAAFLTIYGFLRFRSAWRAQHSLVASGKSQSLRATLIVAAALTWANPHVYLDTVGLLGAIATGFNGSAKVVFAVGASLASFVFFFSLGYGAKFLSPYLQSRRAWQVLDTAIGIVMWWLALGLILNLQNGHTFNGTL